MICTNHNTFLIKYSKKICKMAKRLIFFFIHLIFLLKTECVLSQDFIFKGFKNESSRISLSGVSEIEKYGVLKLTNDTSRIIGHAFYEKPIKFKASRNGKVLSFSTAFVFAIVPQRERLGGHGMAFTISKSKDLSGALSSQYLGLLNSSDAGNFFAVEFDTVKNIELFDLNDNHVGIDVNSLVSNVSVNATMQGLNLSSGKKIQCWIDYDSNKNVLNVTLSLCSSKPSSPILSFPVDLSMIFMDYMYVGFSASTGLLASSHYVLGWSFALNGVAPSLELSQLPSVPGHKTNRLHVIYGASFSAAAFLSLVVIFFYMVKRIKNRDVIESWELDIGPHRYPYKEIKQATKGFRELLGSGGFGRVYKGTLPNSNTLVAVKKINHESKQGLRVFISEIASIGRLRHRNLVQLLGWCRRKGDLLLVYEFMPNGSLDKYIYEKPKVVLTWEQRLKIVKGVASGLLYLHEEWEQIVIHRDIKAANVLLDSELNGKLGDFGLAKLYNHDSEPSTTKVVGTLGYIAPELTKTGKPTTCSDVYGFGALLLEVACGRRPIEVKALPEELILVDWVWDKWKEGRVLEVMDPRLNGEYDEVEALVVLKLGLMCSNNNPAERPSTRQVVRYLEGETAIPRVLVRPDEHGVRNVDQANAKDPRSEDFIHLYKPYSSSSGYQDDVDVETGLTSPLPGSSQGV